MQSNRSRKSGLTLIETLLAMTIFSVVVIGGLLGTRRGFEILDNARHQVRATQILQSEIDSLRTLSWEDLKILPTMETEVPLDAKYDSETGEIYSLKMLLHNQGTTQKHLTLTLSWKSVLGDTKSVKYVTIFAEGGVNDYYNETI